MAGKQQMGDGLAAHIAGMPRSQLFDIMSQMKALIDENQEQARQILVDNPALTRALFQAQIMLGMVKPPKVVPVVPQAVSQAQSSDMSQPSIVQTTQPSSVKAAVQDHVSLSRPPLPANQQNVVQPSIPFPSASSNPTSSLDLPSMSTNPPQSAQGKGFPIHQTLSISAPQSSQHSNVTLPPPPVPSQYSAVPSHMPIVHSQPQQPLQNPGIFNQQSQPPLPQLPRPPSMQPFTHQMHPQIPNSFGMNPANASQHMLQQPMFHPGGNPQPFLKGPPPLPNQPPPQLYQGSSHIGAHYNSQTAMSVQTDRSTPWARGHPEPSSAGSHFPGQLPMVPGQMMTQGIGGPQMTRPDAPLTPEMEKMLVQQVLSMSPEQINMLPPEQRQQVLQLREMLRP